MTPRRSLVALAALTCVGTGGVVAASALPGHEPRTPSPVERVHRFYRAGPTAEYSGDTGSIGVVRPLRFAVTEAEPQTGVVETSFSYRTRGAGPFTMSLAVRKDGGPR